MGASLMVRRCVEEEGPMGCKLLSGVKNIPFEGLTKAPKEAMANSVPAAAVSRRWQALFGFTGRKAHVGGPVS